MEKVSAFFTMLKNHKGKFFLMLASAVIFIFVLFPFNDLGDLVTTQVAKLTQNQVYVQFEGMSMQAVPTPGVDLTKVYVETQGFPPLKADEIVFTPSIFSLFSQKPAGTINAKGFLRGDLTASLGSGPKSDSGVERQKLVLSAKSLALQDIKDLANLPLLMRGNVSIESTALADLTFTEQPDVDLVLRIEKFELPTGNIETALGPVTVPELKLSSVQLKGRLSAGRFNIEEGIIGREGDELRGTIKGGIGLTLSNQGGRITPIIGGYNFDVNLNLKKNFYDKANFLFAYVDQFKSPTADGVRYAFKLSAPSPAMMPSTSALR